MFVGNAMGRGTAEDYFTMSGIQLGDKQVTLEDLDAVILDRSVIQVDPAYLAKVCVLRLVGTF